MGGAVAVLAAYYYQRQYIDAGQWPQFTIGGEQGMHAGLPSAASSRSMWLRWVDVPKACSGSFLKATLRRRAGVHTFGSPMSGGDAFVSSYNAKLRGITHRYVRRTYGDDIVTLVPPTTLGFAHVGRYHSLYAAPSITAPQPGPSLHGYSYYAFEQQPPEPELMATIGNMQIDLTKVFTSSDVQANLLRLLSLCPARCMPLWHASA